MLACGSAQHPSRPHEVAVVGSAGRIEQRALADRPPISIIERQGDPESAIGFASLAAEAPELHAAWGELLAERLTRAGLQTHVVVHGIGFELTLLAATPEKASEGVRALLRALQTPVASGELSRTPGPAPAAGAASAMALCSAELEGRRRVQDVAALDRERIATFAQDRSAFSVVGSASTATAVVDALGAGPDWPERGSVRSRLPDRATIQVLRGERPTLSLALTLADPNRALAAAVLLGEPDNALGPRLAALGAGFRVRRVSATAHPVGACLRIDSDVDASPLPEPRRLGFALATIEEEAQLALASGDDQNRLEATALAATDPRQAARAAAYRSLVAPALGFTSQRLVALTTPEEGPLAPAVEQAIEQARATTAPLDQKVRVEAGQAGVWALISMPCASASERAETAGHAAVFLSAASADATRGVRLEPWIGQGGVGLIGFAERQDGESEPQVAARLGDALGHALVAAPSALEVAAARAELLRPLGAEPRPLLQGLLEALLPGHTGALVPRGSADSLQAASREAVLARQRELLRLPHRLAVLSPTSASDMSLVGARLGRWLRSPDAPRPSPCSTELAPPARGEVSLAPGAASPEGAYLAFRIPAKTGPEAAILAELLNLPGGALERSMMEPDLIGAARALLFGTQVARALVVQVSAFEGREAEALTRVQKLFERLAAGGALSAALIEAALARQATTQRLAALDPRYRLVQLLEPESAPADAAALRRLAASLRPESAILARAGGAAAPAPPTKAAPAR
jgi:hypothetical protein